MLKNFKSLGRVIEIENLIILIISLIPVAIIIGPLIADLFISLISLYYLVLIFYQKKTFLLKNKIFVFFLIFYLYLLINTFLISNIYEEVWLNVLFYFRFFIFVFAATEIISKNYNKLFFIYIIVTLTIIITLIDGYFQFIFGKNLLGYQKLRPDRISGFFQDDLVLGSFLFRIVPVLIFFTIIFKKNKSLFFYNIGIVFFSIILIYLTGDRSSFFLLIIFLLTYLMLLNIKFLYKFYSIILSMIVFATIQLAHPTTFDRYFTQTVNQIYTEDKKILPYYLPLFETAIKISNSNKIFGLGPKSFRYYCSKPEFITYSSRTKVINNKVVIIDLGWKKNNQPIHVVEFFFKENDIISKGDLLFKYKFKKNNNKILNFYSDKAGKIIKFERQSEYFSGNKLADVDPSIFNIQPFSNQIQIGCSTHPHNYYIQLLAETGYIGFFFIIGLFFLILSSIVKNLTSSFFGKKINDIDIIFISFYFALLFPLSTSGNFFNNWLNITSFYPLVFYLLNKKIQIND